MLRYIIKTVWSLVRPVKTPPQPPAETLELDPQVLAKLRPRPVQGLDPRPGVVARFKALCDQLDGVLAIALRPYETGPSRVRPNLRGRWKRDMPNLARICADMIMGGRDLFPGLPFEPEELTEQAEEVRVTEAMVEQVRGTLGKMEALLAVRKDELCRNTQMVVDHLQGLSAAPFLSDEQKKLVEAIAAPVFAHLKRRNGKVQQKRRHYKEVRQGIAAEVAEHKEELARVQAENVVLRGGSLSEG